jgi:hypothetical protein
MRHDKLLDAIVDDIDPKASETSGEATPGITLNDLNAMAEKLSATVDKKISEALEKASAASPMPDKKGTMIEDLTKEHDNDENESEE